MDQKVLYILFTSYNDLHDDTHHVGHIMCETKFNLAACLRLSCSWSPLSWPGDEVVSSVRSTHPYKMPIISVGTTQQTTKPNTGRTMSAVHRFCQLVKCCQQHLQPLSHSHYSSQQSRWIHCPTSLAQQIAFRIFLNAIDTSYYSVCEKQGNRYLNFKNCNFASKF